MYQITELLLELFSSDLFFILGNMASIISLILTFYVFLDVRRIKSYYLFVGRVPKLIKQLQQDASNLLSHWDNFEESTLEIRQELAQSEVVLESLKTKLEGDTKKAVEQLIGDVKKYDQILKQRDFLLDIHLNMSKIIGRLKEMQEDRKWEV